MSIDWYCEATEELVALGASIRARGPIDLASLERVAKGMAASVQAGDELVNQALSAPGGDPIISNLVHVGILAAKLGVGLNFSGEELEHLALAGLLHDIGIFTLSPELLARSGKLSAEERAVLEQHPLAGHDIVVKGHPRYEWLAVVIRQAHERWGGQGYPFRLKGRAIHEFAHVIGICDIFDALVSPRPYRRRLLPHEAIQELFQSERTSFPREIIKALVEQLSVYPLGTQVRLNTGEIGVVIRLNPRLPLRPVIRLDERSARPGMVSAIQDLSAVPTLYVTETLKAPSFPARGTAAERPPRAQAVASAGYSDAFAALFDSLDEIASTIQEAVNAHSAPSSSDPNLRANS